MITHFHRAERDENWSVELRSAKWDPNSSDVTLKKVNLEIQTGKLYCLIGAVGSGKSSLLSALLGEIDLLEGNIRVKGKISYASQDSWIFGATVRQNIVFSEIYDQQRYWKVVEVCALQKDFEQFPLGDQTIVSERGGSLSGGQKARINLARAIYRQADVYLLDDPLSAVCTIEVIHFVQNSARYMFSIFRWMLM